MALDDAVLDDAVATAPTNRNINVVFEGEGGVLLNPSAAALALSSQRTVSKPVAYLKEICGEDKKTSVLRPVAAPAAPRICMSRADVAVRRRSTEGGRLTQRAAHLQPLSDIEAEYIYYEENAAVR